MRATPWPGRRDRRSIVNCSPYTLDNNLAGDIFLQSGTGGSGLFGGAGGGIVNFAQVSTIQETRPAAPFSPVRAAIPPSGWAGAGGGISGVDVAATASLQNPGAYYTFDFSKPTDVFNIFDAVVKQAPVYYNRMVAGAGGISVGGTGGAGGSISSVNYISSATVAQVVVAAGAGGEGLNAGGAGGSVLSATVDAGSQAGSGKAVVIAATAALPSV